MCTFNMECLISIFAPLSFVAAAAAKSLQSCPILCDPIDSSPPGSLSSLGFSRQEYWSGLPFPLQCMKVKSEIEVAQSCPTLSDPTPWTAAHQAPPSMGFSRQEYWSGVLLPSPLSFVMWSLFVWPTSLINWALLLEGAD